MDDDRDDENQGRKRELFGRTERIAALAPRLADVRAMQRFGDAAFRHATRARRAGQPRVAFVLSGGGNQGVAQVGMLRALLEHEIVPDVVVGTSAGALNGSAFATDPSAAMLDRLEHVWLGLTGERVFPGNAFRRAWNILRRDDHLI